MSLSGNEILQVTGVQPNGQPSGQTFPTTTGAIASLASSETSFVSTSITTVGNGTLTGAALAGSQIVRTGPVANFSDATDSAANIIAAFPGGLASGSNSILIKNATAFTQTVTAGTGVTLPPTVIIPPYSVCNYIVQPTSATAVTIVHIDTTPVSVGTNTTAPSITALNTVGAGTITAASFTTGITARGGSQSGTPFADTTDTAAAIIAACANLVNKIGTSFIYYYANSTNAVATLGGGTGVTVSGVTVIPANTIGAYLVTYTAAATITMVGLGVTQSISTAVTIAGSSSGQTIIQPTAAASGTLTLPAATDTLVGRATTDTLTNKTLTDVINTDAKVSTAQLNAVSTTTLAPVTGLAVALTSSGTYQVQASLPVSTNSTAGVAVGLVSSNSLTATSMTVTGKFFTATTAATVNTTTIGGSIGSTTSVILAELSGTIVVNTGGTLLVEAAQNVSTSGTTSILTNAWLQVTRVS